MPRQTEITIRRTNLGGLKTAPDLALVKVLINGALAGVVHAEQDLIRVKAPETGEGPWMILLTSPDGKTLLCPLGLDFEKETGTFDIKQQQGLGAKEPDADDEDDKAADTIAQAIRDAALGDKLDRAADTIAAAIREAARALSSKTPAERAKRE
jgi:hypothetical protein